MIQKLLLAVITFAIGSTSVFASEANMNFYGKANVSIHKNRFDTVENNVVNQSEDNWTLNSNASRLGIKGSAPINDDLKAIYKMEYEVFVDDGVDSKNDEFSQRNIYAGLQGSWGTVIAGKHDTPLKLSQGKVDRFNDLDRGDIKHLVVGENRVSNIVMYTSPKYNGFSVTAAVVPGEDSVGSTHNNDGLFDHISFAATYRSDSFYASGAFDNNVKGTDIFRLVGEYYGNEGNVTIGALLQVAEESESGGKIASIKDPIKSITSDYKEQNAILLSGQWKLKQFNQSKFLKNVTLKAQYIYSESTPNGSSRLDETEASQFTLGADYKLNKSTKVFAYVSHIDADADNTLANSTVADTTMAIGFEMKF